MLRKMSPLSKQQEPTKTILFARVSSREQEETGYSLPAQQKLLEEYAKRKGFKVVRKFSISESASGQKQRKTFKEMLDYIKRNNIKIIVCEKVDRLTRNLKDAVCINEWVNSDSQKEVHFVKESCILNKESKSNDKFIWNIKVSVAQYYIDNLSEEVKKGQMEKIRQGWLPAKPPLGYKTVGETGHKVHIIDQEQAPLIKKMFELYSTGLYSIKKLSQKMYEEGLRAKGGNRLGKSSVGYTLSDPFYCGKIKWNGKIYDGNQEPIVNKELFDKVQQTLNSKTTPKHRKRFYLFKSLIRCKECSGQITWEKHKGHIYGHCNHYKNCQQETWVKEPEIEKQILRGLAKLQIKEPRLVDCVRRALKESHKDETEYHSASLNELKQQHERIERRLDLLYDDRLDEKITRDFYERKVKQYSEEKERITEAIRKHSQASSKYFELGMSIYELSQRAKEVYQELNLERKRRLIGLVFDNLFLDEGKLSFTYTKPFETLARAVKATNGPKVLNLAKSSPKTFEPAKNLVNTSKNGVLHPEFAKLQGQWDDFRTLKWVDSLICPELVLTQTQNLLE